MEIPTIRINLDARCAECKKRGSGAAANGLCLGCTTKAIKGKTMVSPEGRAVQARFNELKRTAQRP